jgi:hypothetical protein
VKPFFVHQVAVIVVEFNQFSWKSLQLEHPLLVARPFTCVDIDPAKATGVLKLAKSIMHFDSTEAIAIKETQREVANLCDATAELIPECDRKEENT